MPVLLSFQPAQGGQYKKLSYSYTPLLKQCFYIFQQIAFLEWFAQVAVDTYLHGTLAMFIAGARGNHNDRDIP